MIIECIELNWLCKYMKKVGSSQADTLVLDCVKQLFPVSIVKIYYLNIRSLGCFKVEIFYLCSEYIYLSVFFALSVVVFFCKRSSLKIFFFYYYYFFFMEPGISVKKSLGNWFFFSVKKHLEYEFQYRVATLKLRHTKIKP